MIWQQDVRTLVMLDEDVYSYWPRKVKTSEVFGEMNVFLQEATNHQTYTNRKLKIISDIHDDKILNVHQLQFHGWPQGGVPEDYTNLIDFIKQVKMKQEQTKMSPLLIHCRCSIYILRHLAAGSATPEKTRTLTEEFKGMDDQTLKRKAVQEFSALTKIQKLTMPQQQQMGESQENAYKNRFPEIIPCMYKAFNQWHAQRGKARGTLVPPPIVCCWKI
ncbi:amPTPR4b [Apostichopus japonicus]|uniref:AmPTPR4b n=1 Tax=Stichopus japonicus TaxID=307972 RepID=A0A2G8KE71_STIJA|nr:amPTPR4b [Apostichopus japonicus]